MSKYTRLATTEEQEAAIQNIEKWAKRLSLKIVGATTISKSTQTVILDLTHQGSEIYISSDGETEVLDKPVYGYVDFIRAVKHPAHRERFHNMWKVNPVN